MTNALMSLWAWIEARYRAEEGATAIEYGLIAALISVVIIASTRLVGEKLVQTFTDVATALGGA